MVRYGHMISCAFENGNKANLRHVVVHAIVEMDGKLLLVKRTGNLLESGKWSLPSGYLDRDETAAEGVMRELLEETGWESEVISLFRVNSRPDRPHEDRQNVSLDFILKPLKKTGTPDGENSKIEWIPIDQLLPFSEFAFDHGESIKQYLAYRKEKFSLPLID
jgi:ADP-ribose pyrophosphatase YjhB (NUDIX family)